MVQLQLNLLLVRVLSLQYDYQLRKKEFDMINVLVVEDDPMVAQLHEHYLSQVKGFQLCDIANNGEAALKLLRQKVMIY